MKIKAEYIWIDGQTPTAKLRSKTKIIDQGTEPPIWGFDGSSTQQATGDQSDCVLKPVAQFPDPVRGGENILVMCEVMNVDMTPHASNTRAALVESAENFGEFEPWFGMEQEYTFYEQSYDSLKYGQPLGFPPSGYPAPQGGYYCGVGADEVYGREISEAHATACIEAGLGISGTNAEVMPGQWEFQIGPIGAPDIGDQIWVARWLLYRIAEDWNISATLDPKPVKGDWNGAGMHTNFSTKQMREDGGYEAIVAGCEALGKNADLHVKNYGANIEDRLTGDHETQSFDTFSYGVSDRGASIRIPWQVEVDKKGYLEDRRPNANGDPYVIAMLMIDTVCSAASS
jgi:glutamine synthetase